MAAPILSLMFSSMSYYMDVGICRTGGTPSTSKKRKRTGILGNNDESDGEVENLPSPGDDDAGNVS